MPIAMPETRHAVCAIEKRSKPFIQTDHYLTSKLPDKDSILGKFTPDRNVLKTSNPELSFRMDKREDGFFQTAVQGIAPYITERTERFGLVVGSGRKDKHTCSGKAINCFNYPFPTGLNLGG